MGSCTSNTMDKWARIMAWTVVATTSFLVMVVLATQIIHNDSDSLADAFSTFYVFFALVVLTLVFIGIYMWGNNLREEAGGQTNSNHVIQIIASFVDLIFSIYLLLLSVISCWDVTNRTCTPLQWQFIVAFLTVRTAAQLVRLVLLWSGGPAVAAQDFLLRGTTSKYNKVNLNVADAY